MEHFPHTSIWVSYAGALRIRTPPTSLIVLETLAADLVRPWCSAERYPNSVLPDFQLYLYMFTSAQVAPGAPADPLLTSLRVYSSSDLQFKGWDHLLRPEVLPFPFPDLPSCVPEGNIAFPLLSFAIWTLVPQR